MTVVVTCLTHDYIVQAADRRLTNSNGTLYDDDTNKAVFYCGRVAVAYAGPAQIEGKPTAEWLALQMKDASKIESAMNQVAQRADYHFKRRKGGHRKFIVVATGWATLRGAQPPLPYVSVASNFMTDSWEWEVSASERMVVRSKFLPKDSPFFVFAAEQSLTAQEEARLSNFVNRVIRSKEPAIPLARLLSDVVQSMAKGSDPRAKMVGKGMIIQLLSKKAIMGGYPMILCGLTPDANSFQYVSSDGRTEPMQGPVIACDGQIVTGFECGSFPRGGKR